MDPSETRIWRMNRYAGEAFGGMRMMMMMMAERRGGSTNGKEEHISFGPIYNNGPKLVVVAAI